MGSCSQNKALDLGIRGHKFLTIPSFFLCRYSPRAAPVLRQNANVRFLFQEFRGQERAIASMSLLVEERACPSSELYNCHVRELVAAFVNCRSVRVIFSIFEVGCTHADDFASCSLQGINVLLKVPDAPTFLQLPFDAVVHRISSHERVASFEVLKSDLIS